jgi:hypothetical protein
MTRAISVLLGLGLLATIGVAADSPSTFQEHAAVQESLSRVHPRMRARWLQERGLDDSYYTTFRRPESTGLRCIGRWPWGPSWELAGRDTFMYLGSGSGVRILSIADSVQPRMLGQIIARSLVSQVVVQDSLLFVACGSWGAQLYSVANPASPRELGPMDAVIGDLCVKDTFCYTVGGGSFRIYNCADPTQPTQVGAASDGGDVIAEADGYVYVGGSSGTGLNVYDVHNPASPTLVNALGGVQLAMFTRGHLLMCVSEQPAYFSIRDVSDPHSIHEVGRIDGYGGLALFADDKYAYLSCSYEHDGLFVVDISDSSHPQLRDSINPEGIAEWDSYVPHTPGYGYLADYHGGLVTLDLHDPDSISEAWSGYKAHSAVDVSIDGQRAYIANDLSGLQIVDVANPTNPVSLGIFDTVGARQAFTTQARDSFAFVGWWGDKRRFLRVLNVTDPTSPMFAAEESCFNPPQDMVLKDTFIYTAEPYEFEVFNVARPREPERVGICESTDGVLYGLAVQDTFAYEVSQSGMWVINVARPDSPFVVSSNVGRNAGGIAVRDTFVYLPTVSDTLWVYSVANPASPRVVGFAPLLTISTDVALGETTAAVATSQGLELFSLRNPAQPTRLGSVVAPFVVRRVVYGRPYYYAAMWDAGVAIYNAESLGLQEQAASVLRPAGLRVYPNPVRNRCLVSLGTAEAAEVRLRDVAGRVVPAVAVQTETRQRLSLDLSKLAAGVYFVEVGRDRRAGTKFVKQ